VSADRGIDEWLCEMGWGLPEARQQARAALERAKLTRPGKQRISEEKLPRASAELAARFFLHCESADCQEAARQSGRTPVRADPKSACEGCGGSDNRRAVASFVEACGRHGIRRLVVVGGSPAVREELIRGLSPPIELRAIDGTERRTSDRARSDVEWADLVLVWGASELHHKVSWLYTQVPPPLRQKVVHVAKRGIAALLAAAVRHLDGN
jgi:hypothetical protein